MPCGCFLRGALSLTRFLYNPKEKTCLQRSFRDLGALGVYYAVFLLLVGLIFSLCLVISIAILKTHRGPWFTGPLSCIGSPELSNAPPGTCQAEKLCWFDLSTLEGCNKPPSYGFKDDQICVILKLNKVLDWEPDVYPFRVPEDMPRDLRSWIKHETKSENNFVWLSCEGYRPVDKDHLGNVTYYPQPGFDARFYPLTMNATSQPLVGVVFQHFEKNLLLTVQCDVWAKNLPRRGDNSLYFQIFVHSAQ